MQFECINMCMQYARHVYIYIYIHIYIYIQVHYMYVDTPSPRPGMSPELELLDQQLLLLPKIITTWTKQPTHPPTCVMQHVFVRQGTCKHILLSLACWVDGSSSKWRQSEKLNSPNHPHPPPKPLNPLTNKLQMRSIRAGGRNKCLQAAVRST